MLLLVATLIMGIRHFLVPYLDLLCMWSDSEIILFKDFFFAMYPPVETSYHRIGHGAHDIESRFGHFEIEGTAYEELYKNLRSSLMKFVDIHGAGYRKWLMNRAIDRDLNELLGSVKSTERQSFEEAQQRINLEHKKAIGQAESDKSKTAKDLALINISLRDQKEENRQFQDNLGQWIQKLMAALGHGESAADEVSVSSEDLMKQRFQAVVEKVQSAIQCEEQTSDKLKLANDRIESMEQDVIRLEEDVLHLKEENHNLKAANATSLVDGCITMTEEAKNDDEVVNGSKAVVFSSMKPLLVVETPKANDAIMFFKAAFGAEEVSRVIHKVEQAQSLVDSEVKAGPSSIYFADDSSSPVKDDIYEVNCENYSKGKAEPLVHSDEPKIGSSSIVVSDLTDDSSAPIKGAMTEVSPLNHTQRNVEQEQPLVHFAELKLGSSFIVVSDLTDDSSAPVKHAVTGVYCLETEDVDTAVAKAIAAGAVADTEGGEGVCCGGRVGKVKDPYGNVWLICAPSEKSAEDNSSIADERLPHEDEGGGSNEMEDEVKNGAEVVNGSKVAVFLAMKPWLVVEAPKASDAIIFFKAAFGATEVSRVNHEHPLVHSAELKSIDDSCAQIKQAANEVTQTKRKAEPLVHSAELKIGSFSIVVSDLTDDSSAPVKHVVTGVYCLETEDIDTAVANAVAAGAVADGAITEGKLKDLYGNVWLICSPSKKCADVEA